MWDEDKPGPSWTSDWSEITLAANRLDVNKEIAATILPVETPDRGQNMELPQ